MTTIKLETHIKATRDVCFDLSRNIDVHLTSTGWTKEEAVGGRTKGLIEEGEWVKWRANHFGLRMTMTVQIREMKEFRYFVDEMISGPFKWMRHEHRFVAENGRTIVSDLFQYETPYGIFGRFFDRLILKRYMRNLLTRRNETIRHLAESGEWRHYLEF